jgi:hypothetical protein
MMRRWAVTMTAAWMALAPILREKKNVSSLEAEMKRLLVLTGFGTQIASSLPHEAVQATTHLKAISPFASTADPNRTTESPHPKEIRSWSKSQQSRT